MEQTIMQVGNSLAITLPKHFVKARRLKAGQKVFVDVDPSIDILQVRTNGKTSSVLTPEFKQWLDKITKKYENTIRELAKK
ncbi:MAG: AbrB/MazE/SpoVT family DNA-binding domain-containing protein [Patescibacteria group bacterium]